MAASGIDFSPPIIAHRGASSRAPENTLSSFLAAREAGVKWIETDVKLTSDGVPVLLHDDNIDRTTAGHGSIVDITWAELQKLDAGSWFSPNFSGMHVLSLNEVVSFCAASDMRLILEIKPSPGRIQATTMVSLIEAAKIWPPDMPPPVISSSEKDALLIASQLHPDWPRSLLLNEWDNNWHEAIVLTESSLITVKDALLTPGRLTALRKTGLPIISHTVNDPLLAKERLKEGVTALYSDNSGDLVPQLRSF